MCRASERGSVLMLMPAAVLVLVVLGAVAVDAAIAFMAQRELQSATAAAANDAAVAALEEARLYECGELSVAADRAATVAAAAFGARVSDTVDTVGEPDVTVNGGGSTEFIEVTVAARGTVDLLFTPAVAGGAQREVTASTTASPRLADGQAWPEPQDC